MNLDKKLENLKNFLREKGGGGAVISFSGGVDSSTLAAICHDILGEKAVAVTIISPVFPREEVEEAKKVAREIGIKHVLIEADDFLDEKFFRNSEDRCYHCKRGLLRVLRNVAGELGLKAIFDGTNYSELSEHRPGLKAVREMEAVYSPWVECGFTKDEIRSLARKIGLSISDKPSMACLASRIPFGERITLERLDRIEKAEQIIKSTTGIRQARVRDHNGLARIEVGKDEREKFFDTMIMDMVAGELKKLGFKYVTMDLEGYRSGSMLPTTANK
ncbi:MAG: ATP-dependent sacrificial sulfur transferase LarE [Nitrososphaeria archaeon]|nr:ATP-dependent sacrificial sulfur transferase LarE [Nitrososphaeria archaeon]